MMYSLLSGLAGRVLLIGLLLFPLAALSQTVHHVDVGALGANDGSSWVDAYADLQDALAAASAGDEIWVATGTYRPNVPADPDNVSEAEREVSFELKDGVALYGGFAGNETTREQRDWHANPTVLSGDINDSGDTNGNSLRVVIGSGTSASTVLDGFVITAGAGSSGGGGMLNVGGSPTVANVIFRDNRALAGGGMFNDGASPTLTHVSFYENRGYGGGMANENNSAPVLTNVAFVNNRGTRGAGMDNLDSNPTLTNVSFQFNIATFTGGGMRNRNSSPILTNVTFSLNGAGASHDGGGMHNDASSNPTIRNAIFWFNRAQGEFGTANASIFNDGASPSITYSLVQGCNPDGSWNADCGTNAGDNLADADPMFVRTPVSGVTGSGNLRLQPGSPAIDAGSSLFNASAADLAGNVRHVGNAIDLGAYEAPATTCPASGTVRVSSRGSSQPADGQTWASAYRNLQDALLVAAPCEIWVADGTYKPTPDPTHQEATFQLRSGIALYGGFTGNETERSQRNVGHTVLSGIIRTKTEFNDRSFNVVTGSGTDSSAILDGFVVTGGYGPNPGGGMINSGGSPTVSNVQFVGNRANQGGGMANLDGSQPVLTNVSFSGNFVFGSGAGMFNQDSSPELVNVSFSGNYAWQNGGGLYNASASPSISNAIFWNNRDNSGTGTAAATVFNLNASPSFRYSLVQGCNAGGSWNNECGSDTGNNLPDADPQFVNTPLADLQPSWTGNLRLQPGSPAIDAGNNGDNPLETDLAGNLRIVGGTIDLGAFELPATACPASGIVHVDRHKATAAGDGLSWASAFRNLQDAMLIEGPCEIWVTAGTYLPSPDPSDRSASFHLGNGVGLYGGFAGTETMRNQRDWRNRPTVLSGDINNSRSLSGNSRTLITTSDVDETTVVDGFVVTGGNALGGASFPSNSGGGMRNTGASPTVRNVRFIGNSGWFGGAVFNLNGSHPLLVNVELIGNQADIGGGAMYNLSSNPTVTNAVFRGNLSGEHGGAMVNLASEPVITNASFSGNLAVWDGGALYNTNDGQGGPGSNPIIRNSIFWNNRDQGGTGNASASIVNDNSSASFSYSLAQGCKPGGSWTTACGSDEGGNLSDTDPQFVSTPNPDAAPRSSGNLRLGPDSPAIDAGNNSFIAGIQTDLDGRGRIIGAAVDLGPYEFAPDLLFRDRFQPGQD